MAPAVKAANANAVASKGRRALGPMTDSKDWEWGEPIKGVLLVMVANCNPKVEHIWHSADIREPTTGCERTFSGAARAARNGMTAPRLRTSATPPASISTDRRANCFLRREDNFNQRRLNILDIFL